MARDRRALRRLGKTLRDMDPDLRERVLGVMATPPERRSRAIGALYADPRTRPIAELLIDIEVDSSAD
jgi:hypothetical protein